MDKPLLENEILNVVHRLNAEDQQKILDFARNLPARSRPRGVPSSRLLKFGGLFPKEDWEEIMNAIEEDCERINYDEW